MTKKETKEKQTIFEVYRAGRSYDICLMGSNVF
jgi:hypothetical protein